MKIAIVGLGLIGGSMAKAIKALTPHKVFGLDIDKETQAKAIKDGAIDFPLNEQTIKECDLILLALYPKAAIKFVEENASLIKKDAVVLDLCGVKRMITKALAPLSQRHGFYFVGGHPMAGRELSGYTAAKADLFKGASMILTPQEGLDESIILNLQNFFCALGFGQVKISSDEKHDKMIAYTSQLAHVLSNAYVKSPLALDHKGFSAGSFQDLSRVALLNAGMWTELFLENADFLSQEIDELCKRLSAYSEAIKNKDAKTLHSLLQEGSDIKEKIL